MFFKRAFSVSLLSVGSFIFAAICSAAPLIVEKNLFSQERKPNPPESAETSAKPNKPGMAISNMQLDGIIIQGNSRKALMRMRNQPGGQAALKKGQSPFVTVREGQQVGDYRVSKIDVKSVSLEKDGQTYTINLFSENKITTPPTPVPAPGPAPGQAPVLQPGNVPPGIPHQAEQTGQVPPSQASAQMPPPNPGAPGFMDPALNPNIQQAPQVQPGMMVEDQMQSEEEQ